jgi:chemotaxis protein methyltransferase CheR
MDCPTISELQARVMHEPARFAQLLQYLTIPVRRCSATRSFTWRCASRWCRFLKTYPSLKVWVAGCSTGEEVYSLAILLREEGLLERALIYATDINPESLDKARRGVFPLDRMRCTPKTTRRPAAPAPFPTTTRPPTTRRAVRPRRCARTSPSPTTAWPPTACSPKPSFISCRNVMIYFNRRLQNRALGLFHESLCHRGFLGLGSKESIDFSSYAQRFDALDRASACSARWSMHAAAPVADAAFARHEASMRW